MSFGAKATMFGRVAQLAGLVLAERVTPTRPAAPGSVPRSLDALSTEWLTTALCGGVPGARVERFTSQDPSAGTSARLALTVGYNEAGTEAGLPTELYTKSTPTLKTKLFAGLSNLYVGESHFYNDIRPELDIESPIGYHASYDVKTCRSLVILENVALTRGATFGDPTSVHIDRPKAEDMVRLMATYHGAFWDSPRFDTDMRWLQSSPDWQRHLDAMINTAAMVRRGLKRMEEVLPPGLSRRRDEVWPMFQRSFDLKARRPVTLLHHDIHSLNWYIGGDGRMGLYDWQCIVKGTWAVDFSYALNTNLTVEDRQAWLDDLLDLYLDELKAAGGDPPSREAAMQAYRQQTIHGLIFWVATAGASSLQPDLHRRDVCLENVKRTAAAAEDFGTLDAIAAAT